MPCQHNGGIAWYILIPSPLTRHEDTSLEDLGHLPDALCDAAFVPASPMISDMEQGQKPPALLLKGK